MGDLVYLRKDLLNRSFLEEIAAEVFDFSKPGAFYIPDAIKPEALPLLVADSRKLTVYGGTPLNGEHEASIVSINALEYPSKKFPEATQQLINDYNTFYMALGSILGYTTAGINHFAVNLYDQTQRGLAKHTDQGCVNIITSATLSGGGKFSVFMPDSQVPAQDFDMKEGSLVVTRQGRTFEEYFSRTPHMVSDFTADRIAYVFREIGKWG